MLARSVLLSCAVALSAATGCGGSDGDQERATSRTAPATQAQAGGGAGGLRLVPVAKVASPTALAAPPRDRRRVFVTEQSGRIRVIRGGKLLRRPFLDLRGRITAGGEQGLLGLAFAPDYAQSRRFYVNYTDKAGDTRIVEFKARRGNPDVADPASARLVLRAPGEEPNHNGGQLQFGPDRNLYIATGDGGGGNDQHGARGHAQDLGSLLGKILRIDPRRSGSRAYRVPADNPFAKRSGARPEIYSYGLRNPWRFSFDRGTGDLTIADVGQDAVEEIDFVTRDKGSGANFGWRPFEGTRRLFEDEDAPGHVKPVIEQPHDDGWCSITGGYVVRDPGLPALRGQYLYADFCLGRVHAVRLSAGGAEDDRQLDLPEVSSISSFGEDAQGRIYTLSLEGRIARLTQG
ncbi:MAG TPA: PQQ-dependent sugar dehydrogenase [Solirubrobacteraceae bacterium]|nr:PQQ-dependent sugar dehydrogenase [Solirubrobacteraceae bacterium]